MADSSLATSMEAPSDAIELASKHRLLLIANALPYHVGGYFVSAAKRLGMTFDVSDTRLAVGSRWLQSLYWRLADRRYVRQSRLTKDVLERLDSLQPTIVLTVGICPVLADTIRSIRDRNIRCVNFLTDDPFNKHHFCKWFMAALPNYHTIYTPRHSNTSDLIRLGCSDVKYLPFAFDPQQHHPTSVETANQQYDVLFVGGADEDRVPFIKALSDQGLKVLVLGGYWNRYPMENVTIGGMATVSEIRSYSSVSKVAVVLVRHNNRDGHVMRSFEAAAMGSCLAVEDTEEHRAIFGPDETSVKYFRSPETLARTVSQLLYSVEQRRNLANKSLDRVRHWHNTYDARLLHVLSQNQHEGR